LFLKFHNVKFDYGHLCDNEFIVLTLI